MSTFRHTSTADRPEPLTVVVACFPGDIAAPCELVSALPADCGAALIFVEQPSAGRISLLAEALMKTTTLPVVTVYDDDLLLKHGRLYLVTRNAVLTMTRGHIHAQPATKTIDCLADDLFISFAQDAGDRAIGVILSGGGSERALGIRAIKQAGGATFAQYPGSARFPNLPISAIDTGNVDFVLRPNEIAHQLARMVRHKEKASYDEALKHTQVAQANPSLTRRAPAAASLSAE